MKQEKPLSKTQQIRNQILRLEKGTIFLSDIIDLSDRSVLRVILSRIIAEGLIERLGPGIYLYPRYSALLQRNVTPSLEEIAQAIALKEHSRIVLSGSYSMYKLGFTTQVPTKAVFLTDGSPRKITLVDGRTIVFKSTTAKNLAFKNPLMQLLVSSLKMMRSTNISPEQVVKIRTFLTHIPDEDFQSDIKLAPERIQKLLIQHREDTHVALQPIETG